jgi:hypothetical protein
LHGKRRETPLLPVTPYHDRTARSPDARAENRHQFYTWRSTVVKRVSH